MKRLWILVLTLATSSCADPTRVITNKPKSDAQKQQEKEQRRRDDKAATEALRDFRITDQARKKTKEANPFLQGVPAILDALRSGRIECRVYDKDKFHAKAYITHGRLDVVGSSALVGSSNFTHPGLTENIEQGSVLEQQDELVGQRRDHDAERLRQHDRHRRPRA